MNDKSTNGDIFLQKEKKGEFIKGKYYIVYNKQVYGPYTSFDEAMSFFTSIIGNNDKEILLQALNSAFIDKAYAITSHHIY